MACHEDNPYGKFFGSCNDLKLALDKCFVVSRVMLDRVVVSWQGRREKEAERRTTTMDVTPIYFGEGSCCA